jgi:hypothetical protein
MKVIHSLFISVLIVLLSSIQSFQNLQLRYSVRKSTSSSETSFSQLFVSKHYARYGQFLDTVKRRKDDREKLLNNVLSDDELKKYQREATTGDELKKAKERNLKIAQKQIPTFDYGSSMKTRKWSQDQINDVIECLNRSYNGKERSELTDEERVGVIDWFEFDKHADEVIESYADDEKLRKKVKSWVEYHREKKEIRFENDTWLWKARKPYVQKIRRKKQVKK